MDDFHIIESSSTVIIDQQMNTLEGCCKCFGCCCIDFSNQYDWIVDDKVKFSANEDSGNCARFCCNPNYALTLNVTAKGDSKRKVLQVKRPFKGCCFAIGCCRKSITVEQNGVIIGKAEQPTCGGCCTPELDLYNNEEPRKIGTLSGPTCCIGGCCGGMTFRVADPENEIMEIARFKKAGAAEVGLRRGLFSDADKYKLDFVSDKLTIEDKLVLLSTVMFVDYLFFEGETTCLVNCCVCPPQCWCKLCELYCCGCACPLRVKCCIPEEGDKD
jgi:hypothetical protein